MGCKKKCILILTAVYPAEDLPKEYTPVVHYFAREWVKLGYEVLVVNYEVDFPPIMMKVANLYPNTLASHFGTVARTKAVKEKEYIIDEVKVKRIIPRKYIIHGPIPKTEKKKALDKTLSYLEENNFIPDYVISHWSNPQLEIMEVIKKIFNIPSCYIAHLPGDDILRIKKRKEAQQLIDNIDIIGFRSDYIKKEFLSRFEYKGKTFQCYSGIPEEYISKDNIVRDFSKLDSFIYVGTLIERKYPSVIIPAVSKAMPHEAFSISYIGDGAQITNIKKQAAKYSVESNVQILGRMQRDQVVEHLKQHDFFIMISKQEAFGLVYLEAMAVGCITIAARKEGFDGIIEHGKNGFLCEAGNEEELKRLIIEIRNLPKEKIINISQNAIRTAKELTEKKAAQHYLDSILSVV